MVMSNSDIVKKNQDEYIKLRKYYDKNWTAKVHHHSITGDFHSKIGILHIPIPKLGENDFKRRLCLNEKCVNFNNFLILANYFSVGHHYEWRINGERFILKENIEWYQQRFCCKECKLEKGYDDLTIKYDI